MNTLFQGDNLIINKGQHMILYISIGIVIGGIGVFTCIWWMLDGAYKFEQRRKHKKYMKN